MNLQIEHEDMVAFSCTLLNASSNRIKLKSALERNSDGNYDPTLTLSVEVFGRFKLEEGHANRRNEGGEVMVSGESEVWRMYSREDADRLIAFLSAARDAAFDAVEEEKPC